MKKVIAWLRNSKKAIIAAAGPIVTVWLMDWLQTMEWSIPSTWVAIFVTGLLTVVFGAVTYAVRNIPPNVAGVIDGIVDETTK